jgi:hypothetical protein
MLGERAFRVEWPLEGGGTLALAANVGDESVVLNTPGTVFHSHGRPGDPWSAAWSIA